MQKITLFLFLFVVALAHAQEASMLGGRIMADSLQSDAIHVINKTKEIGTISDASGYFEIKATKGDTLVFSSIQYALKQHIVGDDDFISNTLKIKLEPSVNQLDEVLVRQYSLTGKLEDDLQEIPTYTENLPFWNAGELEQMGVSGFNDAQSPVKNLVLQDEMEATPINLMSLVNLVAKSLKGKGKLTTPNFEIVDFYDEKFIVEILEVPETEYYNFIDFVNEDARTAFVLKMDDQLKILEYLMHQRDVFIEKYTLKN
ncbi:carboxypeptidase-like regulatory domain-containing protein [Aquimarina gracilis]|uniref:Carboxypeptidase-like regulatory domain-containing protein n=1 Tax=Aquimarina gracilis TaxID=874422 RepID=A0ABU5ZSB7_9FLAO|nr:carboxypeptidase-like regulatory domain-containing protein [Aquimarina gracilis]MEB3344272.1 carboxypeptidase-like regulatory domain-containing protein [Aquimarina gracilis]